MRLETKPDWLANLDRDGFCVVPGVIAKEACSEFCDEAHSPGSNPSSMALDEMIDRRGRPRTCPTDSPVGYTIDTR